MRLLYNNRLWLTIVAALAWSACTNEVDEGSRPRQVDFSFQANPANPLEVSFTNTAERATHYAWDFGDDSPISYQENPTHLFKLPGTYTVVLNARSKGGSILKSVPVVVEGNEPPNLIAGGDMSDPDLWSIISIGAEPPTAAFVDGGLKFFNGAGPSSTHEIAYTAVEVEAGKTYRFSANVKGSGATNTWFELYFGTAEPQAGQEYTTGLYTGLNTWDGCGASAFNGNLATLGCKAGAAGNGKEGIISFDETGTIYLVFKVGTAGGSFGTDGITLDDVKLFEEEE